MGRSPLLTEAQAIYATNHANDAWLSWFPRADRPSEYDQQTAFVNSRDLVSFALGGNGSGKTACAAKKCADFLLTTPPPRKNTPFWILAEDYTQVCEVCWSEKLNGQKFLPDSVVDWGNIEWFRPKQNWPFMVPLVKHANGNNWRLEFRSYAQGWKAQQARSIGGFWFSEQVDWSVFLEVLRGCRDYMFPGGQFLEFTPLQPELCIKLEKAMDNPPRGWGFYRMNTRFNTAVSEDWKQAFFSAVSKEMLATRMTGELSSFQGCIYTQFNVHTHVEYGKHVIPLGVHHHRGFDFGGSPQHPMTAVLGYYDSLGDWHVYAEYWSTEPVTGKEHAKRILALSIAWGWPIPEEISRPTRENIPFAQAVLEMAAKLNPGYKERPGEYGMGYSGSDRPDLIRQFNEVGLYTSGGTHEVLKGIEKVAGLLEPNPTTSRPRLMVHERCQHLIEERRKYRWKTREDEGIKPHEPFKLGPFKAWDDTVDAERYMIYNVEKSRGITMDSAAIRPNVNEAIQIKRAGNGHPTRLAQTGNLGWFQKSSRR